MRNVAGFQDIRNSRKRFRTGGYGRDGCRFDYEARNASAGNTGRGLKDRGGKVFKTADVTRMRGRAKRVETPTCIPILLFFFFFFYSESMISTSGARVRRAPRDGERRGSRRKRDRVSTGDRMDRTSRERWWIGSLFPGGCRRGSVRCAFRARWPVVKISRRKQNGPHRPARAARNTHERTRRRRIIRQRVVVENVYTVRMSDILVMPVTRQAGLACLFSSLGGIPPTAGFETAWFRARVAFEHSALRSAESGRRRRLGTGRLRVERFLEQMRAERWTTSNGWNENSS